MIPLDLLQTGERAEICEVDGGEDSVHRLAEIGLRVGVEIRMQQPGQPCVLAIGDHRLSVRLDPSTQIYVTVTS